MLVKLVCEQNPTGAPIADEPGQEQSQVLRPVDIQDQIAQIVGIQSMGDDAGLSGARIAMKHHQQRIGRGSRTLTESRHGRLTRLVRLERSRLRLQGRRLQKLREGKRSAEVSQTDFCDRCGMNTTYAGDRLCIPYSRLRSIANPVFLKNLDRFLMEGGFGRLPLCGIQVLRPNEDVCPTRPENPPRSRPPQLIGNAEGARLLSTDRLELQPDKTWRQR
jgi:hypothetical protein